jgi:methyl-accepting chemotaxis protein
MISPQPIKAWLQVVCFAFLAFSLGVVAFHMLGWAEITTKTLLHLDSAIGEMHLAMKSVNTAMIDLSGTIEDFDKVVWKFDDLADAGVDGVKQIAEHVSQITEHANEATDNFNTLSLTLDREIKDVSGTLQESLDSIPPMAQAGTQTLTSIKTLISDPDWAATLKNTNQIAANIATATSDLAKKEKEIFWPPPYKGRFKALHKVYVVGRGIIGISQPAYYTKELFAK